jgi:hypothetical protein
MNELFKTNVDNLAELCDLPRQSVCFQIMILLNMFTRSSPTKNGINFVKDEDNQRFFDAASIRECMANHKTQSNIHKGFVALLEAGFIERLIIDHNGDKVMTATYSRNFVTIYYKLSEKGLNLFQ